MAGAQRVDHNAIKFGQVTIMAVLAAAWLLGLPWLVPVLAAALLANVAWPAGGPLRLLYRHVALPLRVIRPHLVVDEAAPHRFSQGVGVIVLAASSAALYAGAFWWGWGLAALVAVLAAINVFWNFCAGCFLYYQLRRMGVIRREQAA
ncbi:MAG TPA: DUF4395 family protein [bacterium]|jgi:hypothetical protein|nr:DUF4395 family protein [bacterium]